MAGETEEQYREHFADAAPKLVRLVVGANASGVAATITVIAATAKNGSIEPAFALPLGSFAIGVFFVILYSMGTVFRLARAAHEYLGTPKFFESTGFALITGFGAVLCFLIGLLAGVFIIAFPGSLPWPGADLGAGN